MNFINMCKIQYFWWIMFKSLRLCCSINAFSGSYSSLFMCILSLLLNTQVVIVCLPYCFILLNNMLNVLMSFGDVDSLNRFSHYCDSVLFHKFLMAYCFQWISDKLFSRTWLTIQLYLWIASCLILKSILFAKPIISFECPILFSC